MGGLVDQLQRDALDQSISVSTLLRKVKLTASKLALDNVAGWVECEISGYKQEPPSYRKYIGQAQGLNPYRGWIPIHGDPRFIDLISTVYIMESVSSIEHLVLHRKGDTAVMPIDYDRLSTINELLSFKIPKAQVPLPYSFLAGIIDHVRTLILDWAIELERAGIRGDGLTFSESEKTRAHDKPMTIHIGTISNFAGNIGSENTSGSISLSAEHFSQVLDIENKIRRQADAYIAEGVDKNDLMKTIDELKLAATKNDREDTKSKISALIDILKGATGGILSGGTILLLKNIFG